jgi:hypothetical protein
LRPKFLFQYSAKIFRATGLAGDVVADVGHYARPWREGKHAVKRRHAVNFRWRNIESQGRIVEGTRAGPANALLNCVQNRKQQVPLRSSLASSTVSRASIRLSMALATFPT